jgi:hypothetical protein
MPTNKGAAYKRLQARTRARKEAYKASMPGDEAEVTYIETLAAYVFGALQKTLQLGLHFKEARVKTILVPRVKRHAMQQWEVRNRGRIYMVTVEDVGKITGIARDDVEYGGSGDEDEPNYEDEPFAPCPVCNQPFPIDELPPHLREIHDVQV